LSFFTVKALARIAAAQASFFTRFQPQTTLAESTPGGVHPLDVVRFLRTVKSPILEKQGLLGAKERVASRLIASRLPAAIVNERRRNAKK